MWAGTGRRDMDRLTWPVPTGTCGMFREPNDGGGIGGRIGIVEVSVKGVGQLPHQRVGWARVSLAEAENPMDQYLGENRR